jgi:type II secretory pathway component PulJ
MRGAILLETLLAIALFAGAAIFTIAALRSALDATRRTELRLRASDVARSAIAEIESGLARESDFMRREQDDRDGLRIEVHSSPSGFEGLTLIEATVFGPRDDRTEYTIVTLRQLVRVPDERTSTQPARDRRSAMR